MSRSPEYNEGDSEESDIIEILRQVPSLTLRTPQNDTVWTFYECIKRKWCNKYYEQKRVEVSYIIEGTVIIIVTVYVFYGKCEG